MATDEAVNLSKKIFSEEKKLEKLENSIYKRENRILRLETKIYSKITSLKILKSGLSKAEAKILHSGFVIRFSKHKIVYSLTTFVSVVLLWNGITRLIDKTPGLSNPLTTIFVGIAILILVDKFHKIY